MQNKEVLKWKDFAHPDGKLRELSFLDAHEVIYTHSLAGKPDRVYTFLVTYSFHCFCKDYEQQSEQDKEELMYEAPRDRRPFCEKRYFLARNNLRRIIENLGKRKILHAKRGNYAVVEIETQEGKTGYYFVAFSVFREKKKLRLHVKSAYPIDLKPNGQQVSFFIIAHNLLNNRELPHPLK